MKVEEMVLLKVLDIIESGYELWRDLEQDDEDLELVRQLLQGKTREEKVAILQQRSDELQAKADALKQR